MMPYTSKQINIPYLMKVGNAKIQKIGKYLFDKDLKNVAVFFSLGMESIVAEDLYVGFGEQGIKVAHKETINDINIEDIVHTAFKLPKETKAIVGIGGGKALDYAKYCAHLLRIPFISVPTSTSNDGFCSPNTSLLVEGKRKSIKSTIPFGVIIDLDIIKTCPPICFYSGLGDMVSKITALWDWKQAFLKGYERYNDFASLMAYNSLDLLFIKHSSDITSPEFHRSLSNSLLMSGITMEIAGTSRPASGSEHLISHALDEIAKKPKMHGIQVGVATYLCALLQNNESADTVKEFLVSTGFAEVVKKDPLDKEDFIKALKLAPSIKADFYTILSEKDSYDRAVKLIEEDELLKSFIV